MAKCFFPSIPLFKLLTDSVFLMPFVRHCFVFRYYAMQKNPKNILYFIVLSWLKKWNQ